MTTDEPRGRRWWRVALWTYGSLLIGGHIGALAGVLAGGLNSAIFGQPFSGRTGWQYFDEGLVFPGWDIFAPIGAAFGAAAGGAIALYRCLRRARR